MAVCRDPRLLCQPGLTAAQLSGREAFPGKGEAVPPSQQLASLTGMGPATGGASRLPGGLA